MIDSQRVIQIARDCIGTPFQHQARVPGIGLDCAGVLVHVLQSLDLPCIDERGYPRYPYRGLIKSILDSQPSLRSIPRSELAAGDWLLMRFKIEPQHVALFTGSTMIHAYSGSGRVVEHSLDQVWKKRITHVYRIID